MIFSCFYKIADYFYNILKIFIRSQIKFIIMGRRIALHYAVRCYV